MTDERARCFHFVAYPAEDLPGQWVAHCLDFDVMSQGDSLRHSLAMLSEALTIVVHESDLSRHKRAPEEDWEEFRKVMHGR